MFPLTDWHSEQARNLLLLSCYFEILSSWIHQFPLILSTILWLILLVFRFQQISEDHTFSNCCIKFSAMIWCCSSDYIICIGRWIFSPKNVNQRLICIRFLIQVNIYPKKISRHQHRLNWLELGNTSLQCLRKRQFCSYKTTVSLLPNYLEDQDQSEMPCLDCYHFIVQPHQKPFGTYLACSYQMQDGSCSFSAELLCITLFNVGKYGILIFFLRSGSLFNRCFSILNL